MTEPDIDLSTASGVTEVVTGPGYRLRRARERQGLDVTAVADRLHLPEKLVIAIENDDYAALPGSVFAQGYLRNYARQVGEPPDEIVRMYNDARPREEYKPALHQFQLSMKATQVNSSHGLVKAVTWLIVIALLILFVVWWRGYISLPLPVLGEEQGADSERGAAAPAPAVAPDLSKQASVLEIPAPAGPAPLPPPAVGDVGRTPADGAETPEVAEEPRDIASEVPAVEEAAGEVAEQEDLEGETAPSVVAGTPAPNEVRLAFDAPCWVDIRDATGAKVLYGGVGAGETHGLSGTPPYQVLLGNSSAVRITIGGEQYPTEQHSSGRVARFVLDPERAMSTVTQRDR